MKNEYNVFAEALNIAGMAHRKQARRGTIDGRKVSYMTHPTKVAFATSAWSQGNYRLMAAAILHDVLEDCNKEDKKYFEDKIKDLGEDIFDTVKILTKKKKDTYEEYIKKIVASENLGAIVIKSADICANINDSELFYGELSDKIKNKIKIIVENFLPVVEKTDDNPSTMKYYMRAALTGIVKKTAANKEG